MVRLYLDSYPEEPGDGKGKIIRSGVGVSIAGMEHHLTAIRVVHESNSREKISYYRRTIPHSITPKTFYTQRISLIIYLGYHIPIIPRNQQPAVHSLMYAILNTLGIYQ